MGTFYYLAKKGTIFCESFKTKQEKKTVGLLYTNHQRSPLMYGGKKFKAMLLVLLNGHQSKPKEWEIIVDLQKWLVSEQREANRITRRCFVL